MIETLNQYAAVIGLSDVGRSRFIEAYELCQRVVHASAPPVHFNDAFVENYITETGNHGFGNAWFFANHLCATANIFGTRSENTIMVLQDRVSHCRIERQDYDFSKAQPVSRLYLEFSLGEGRFEKLVAAGANCDYLSKVALKYIAANFQPYSPYAMRGEWDSLSLARREFWELLRRHYVAAQRAHDEYPDTLDELVEASAPPVGLPLIGAEQLRDYHLTHAGQLLGPTALLYKFCRGIYPSRVEGRQLAEVSAITDKGAFTTFHEARGKLAKFWDRWWEHGEEFMTLDRLIATYPGQRRLLTLLSYLEVALTDWTSELGQGKRYLFALAAEWSKYDGHREQSTRDQNGPIS